MAWKETLSIVRKFDDVFIRLSARVETAHTRNEQLTWKNYRKWYQKLVRDTKRALRSLKQIISNDVGLLALVENLTSTLKNVFDIDSDTRVKWSEISAAKQIWQQFKAELDNKIRQEYDLFPQRTFEIDHKLCFVLMPFDKSFDDVYSKAIKPAVTRAKLKAKRADEIFTPTPIVKDIWEYINKSAIIIADATDRNPNVFYEMGLAHALPKRLIILTQKKEDVPFDVQYIRWIKYTNDVSGRKELTAKVKKAIDVLQA